MTMVNAIDGSHCRVDTFELAMDPRTGEAALVFIPLAIWERVPASVRQAACDVDISLQDGVPVNYLLPVEIFDRIRSDIEAAADLLLAESAEQTAVRADVIIAELRP
jgi:hypothetical protein